MLKNALKVIGLLASSSILVLVIAVVARQAGQEISLSSVERSSEYHSTSTLNAAAASETFIFTGSGTLGSVVVVSTTAASGFIIYDADTVTSTPTSTIAVFPANATAGTYTFDVALQQGLKIIVPSGFNGHFVTTYRQN